MNKLAKARKLLPPQAIVIISLGGTILMREEDRKQGAVLGLKIDQLLGQLPGGRNELCLEEFCELPSPHLTLDQISALAQRLNVHFASGAAGAVVVQGTDAIEEAAFLLDRLVQGDAPVIVTGAMRHSSSAGADGLANLRDAVTVACSAEVGGLGCLVVMDGAIHAARSVSKLHTAKTSAFNSSLGGVGQVIEGNAFILARPRRAPVLAAPPAGAVPPVASLLATLGDDGTLVRAALDADYQGIVISCFGGGHVPPRLADALEFAARKVPVVYTTRTAHGVALRSTYGFEGGEIDLQRRGLICGGGLSAPKAHALLSLHLANGWSLPMIADDFAFFAGG